MMCGFYELLSGSMNYKLYIFDIRKSISLILFFGICLWYGIYIIYIYMSVSVNGIPSILLCEENERRWSNVTDTIMVSCLQEDERLCEKIHVPFLV